MSKSLPSLCFRSGTASKVAGESLPSSITSWSGGELINGRKLTFIQEEWAGREELFDATFGDMKSKRKRLGPGVKWTNALKWESLTGHIVGGKLS